MFFVLYATRKGVRFELSGVWAGAAQGQDENQETNQLGWQGARLSLGVWECGRDSRVDNGKIVIYDKYVKSYEEMS